MVMIDKNGDLVGVEGTVEELCENVATLYATVIQHVIDEGKEKGDDMGYTVVEVMTEATIRTVMDLVEDEAGVEKIVNACRTVGETGVTEESQYRLASQEGLPS